MNLNKRKEKIIVCNPKFIVFTEEDLIERIQKSEEDYRNGRFMTQSELEEVSSKW